MAGIRKETENFLNNDDVIDLILIRNWGKLFNTLEGITRDFPTFILHQILVDTGIVSTEEILQSTDFIPCRFFAPDANLQDFVIPSNIKILRNQAFSKCDKLTSITISENSQLSLIAPWAFYNCKRLKSVNISKNVRNIGDGAFSNCIKLTDITIPNSITHISNSMFNDCQSLKNVTIPDSVSSIGYNAFYGCRNLASIIIPGNVTSIGWNAFGSCNNLKTIYFNGTQDEWNQVNKHSEWIDGAGQIEVIFKR